MSETSEESVKLRFESFQAFLDEFAERVSERGLFLATDSTRPVGSMVRFELGLDSDFPILRGIGEVVRVFDRDEAEGPGMAVRFQDPEPSTVTVARRIVERQRARAQSVFDLEVPAAAEAAPLAESAPTPEDEPVPIGTFDLPKVGEPPVVTPTQAVDALIVEGDESTTEVATPSVPLEMPSEVESEPEPVPIHPWEEESELRKSGRALWMVLALLVVAAGAAYWQRDALQGLVAGGSDASPAVERQLPVAAGPVEAQITEPEPSEAAEVAAVEPESASEPSEPLGPIRRIEEIRWTSDDQGTILELIADGAIADDGYSIERLVDPPRVVLKVRGVVTPLARPNLAIGSSEIVGVRTGLHGTPPDSALHVVVDLADPTAEAGAAGVEGRRLQVRVASGAVSP